MNKVSKMIISICCVIIIGVESFLLIKSFLKTHETMDNNSTLEQELESVSKENNQITTDYLLTIISDYQLNIFDQFKMTLDFKEIDIQKKLTYAYFHLNDTNDFSKGVSKQKIEKLFLKVFGDEEVDHQDIICDCGKTLISYNKETGIYQKVNHPGHGGSTFAYGAAYNKPLSLTISNNQYKLTVNKLFINNLNTAYSSVMSDESTVLFENELELSIDDIIKKYEATYEEYSKKSIKYSYTFEKKNNKFILIKYEILD